jgi:coenzyme PQQ precursor peptide PqqA
MVGFQPMQWVEPQFEEILLGCEINSYAVAEL